MRIPAAHSYVILSVMGSRNKHVRWGLAGILILQTIVYIVAGFSKVYLHMDEAYSQALVQYDKIEIQENPDFYDTWHTAEYFQDYLSVQEKDLNNFTPVYENQKNDVHPPLYYLLLRMMLNLAPGKYSKWPGIILNVVIAIPITILVFVIARRLLSQKHYANEKALGLTLVVALTVATVSGVMYIRMYLLLTLWVLLTAWLHLQLVKGKNWRKYCVLIGLTALLGVLTQYYYLFFLVGAALVAGIYYIRQKDWQKLVWYFGSLVVAGGLSLLIWPWSLQHMFFSYRGQGVLQSFLNVPKLLSNLWQYILLVDYYVFHRALVALILLMAGVSVYAYCKQNQNSQQVNVKAANDVREKASAKSEKGSNYKFWQWQVVVWPTVIYFVIVAAVSPFIELRYVLPVCGLILILGLLAVNGVLSKVLSERAGNTVMAIIAGVILLIAPVQIACGAMRVELLYRDRAKIMEFAEVHTDVPAVYFITTENNRFLDNILPFATFENSYLALDYPDDVDKIHEIVEGKDLSRGLVVFVSDRHDQERRLETVKAATGLQEVRFIQVLNTCSAYYLE